MRSPVVSLQVCTNGRYASPYLTTFYSRNQLVFFMFRRFGQCRIELTVGDITNQQIDAIANAANSRLAGGGGVDGAIHAAAGPALMMELKERFPEGCPTGSAVATSAGDLKARFVIHAVGPVWKGGRNGEPAALESAYRTCLKLALKNECESIAFPAISTGVYGYPFDMAATTALTVVHDFLVKHEAPSLVRFVLFTPGDYAAFARVLEEMTD